MEGIKCKECRIGLVSLLLAVVLSVQPVSAQNTVLKNNLLYDATGTFNLGVETKLSSHWSFEFNAGYNPWTFSHDKKWKHLMLSPQVRYWFKRKDEGTHVDADRRVYSEVYDPGTGRTLHQGLMRPESYDLPARFFTGWFVGADLVYSHFNAGNVKFPFGMYKKVRDQRMQGNLYAGGLFFGHSWELNYRWNLSADLGLNVGYYKAKTYECGHCGTYKGKDDDVFLLPKMGVNIIYKFGKKPEEPLKPLEPKQPEQPELISFYRPMLFKAFTPHVADNTGMAGKLQQDNPVLQHISKYQPYSPSRILRKEEGALYVYFPVDKSDLRRDFRDNAATLDRIISIVDEVLADSTSDVKIIQIVGMASIEGPEARNQKLGADRGEALKQYIIAHSKATSPLFDCANGGEAWSEFRDQVNDASFDGKEQILAIIDSSDDVAAKERKIKALNGGSTYAYLKKNILVDQRNSGYIRIYYDYVPDENAAVINRAIDMMASDPNAALKLLRTVESDARSWNAIGAALCRIEKYEEALPYFDRAAETGDSQARQNAVELRKMMDYNQKMMEENAKVQERIELLKAQGRSYEIITK